MTIEAMRKRVRELVCSRHFVIGERDRHSTFRQFDGERSSDRQSIFGHIDEKQIARLGVGRARCDARENGRGCQFDAVALDRVRKSIDRCVEFVGQPFKRRPGRPHIVGQRHELVRDALQRNTNRLR